MKNMHNKDEAGLVSIVVVLIIMIMLGLITVAFSRITRREQRQALDRELSTQALYAAETGVNDAVNKIKTGAVSLATDYTASCDGFMTAASLTGKVDGGSGASSYTCLFVDPTPTAFKFSNVDTNSSKIFPITPKNVTDNIVSIAIGWQGKDGGPSITGCNSATPAQLPSADSWPTPNCNTGILRVDIVPVGGPGVALSRDFLLNNTITVYLYPKNAGGSTTINQSTIMGFTKQGAIQYVNCPGSSIPFGKSEQCNVIINGFGAGVTSKANYMMRIKSIYRSSTVSVQALDSSNVAYELKDGQAIIDATGKTTDVLRRTQIRIPLSNYINAPEFAAQSVETLCKRFAIAPPSTFTPDGAAPECNVIN